MRTLTEADQELRGALGKDRVHKKAGKGSSGPLQYIKAGGVALAMNEAFTPLGWDVEIDDFEILEKAHKINTMGLEDAEKGTYWNAIAYATVTVKARAMYQKELASYEEVSRTDVGVGSAVGGKAKTKVDAYQNAITSAVTNAFKRACRFFGPKTGLTLQFEPGERESIQMQIDAMGVIGQTEGETEGTSGDAESAQESVQNDAAAEEAGAEQASDAPAASPVVQTEPEPTPDPVAEETEVAAEPEPTLFGPVAIPEVMKSFAGAEIERVCALESGASQVAPADVASFHGAMAKAFGGPKVALGIWRAAGVTPGKGVTVTRDNILAVAQVLDEASAGEGGLPAFMASLQAPAPTTPATQDKVGTATVIINGQHVAGPAPTAPPPAAPVKAPVEPVVSAPTNGNGETHGDHVQRMWDESSLGESDRRTRYLKRFGESKREIVELLATVQDEQEVQKVDAGKVHAVAVSRLNRLNMPVTDVTEMWKKAGYSFSGGGQPKGKHLRAFADLLPD